jgi:hypothetical protein
MSVGPPVFPGGMETAPELTSGGECAYEACLCRVEPGPAFCCPACARGRSDEPACPCGHFGCLRTF